MRARSGYPLISLSVTSTRSLRMGSRSSSGWVLGSSATRATRTRPTSSSRSTPRAARAAAHPRARRQRPAGSTTCSASCRCSGRSRTRASRSMRCSGRRPSTSSTTSGRLSGRVGELVSLFALHGPAHGVVTDGLVYPLHGETLEPGSSRGVSNVFAATEARVAPDERRPARRPAGLTNSSSAGTASSSPPRLGRASSAGRVRASRLPKRCHSARPHAADAVCAREQRERRGRRLRQEARVAAGRLAEDRERPLRVTARRGSAGEARARTAAPCRRRPGPSRGETRSRRARARRRTERRRGSSGMIVGWRPRTLRARSLRRCGRRRVRRRRGGRAARGAGCSRP